MSLDHIIRFATDVVGLERILRFWQSVLMLTVSSPTLLGCLVAVLSPALGTATATATDPAKYGLVLAQYQHVFVGLRDQVNIVRRYFRIFRTAESFQMAHRLFGELLLLPNVAVAVKGPEKEAREATEDGEAKKTDEKSGSHQDHKCHSHTNRKSHESLRSVLPPWLSAFGRAFHGMHLLLELVTLPDNLNIDGLSAWGPETAGRLIIESQRFWFLSLACNLASGLLRLSRLTKELPLSEVPIEEPAQESPLPVGSDMIDDPAALSDDISREQARLRRIARAHLNQRRAWRRRLRARAAFIFRHALADGLDILLSGTNIGWLSLHPATAGAVMMTTSLLTGWDAWERCGTEVLKKSG
ncbi:hypothetical protein CMQ_5962 [Grosmannia clavigera kw1407]|uniref:AoPex11B-like protein n=1 Tax=Grosmannia clavigera (strain kw1407 / UAMH 11150) TaxID=655863 RepID=F0XMJ9_GROCL|nr:uncharacterized protein CMQ_5962 [Grosmannia clavigera kw1407]EFX01020.1 hypothetical protein CMQ_5962 [Grosmannia clavigera kw1407]